MSLNKPEAFIIIRRIVFFALLILFLDWIFGIGLEFLYFKQKSGLYARTTYGLEKTTAELLVFGSSSANHHYNPSIFKEILNISAYNEGRDGIEILYHTAILKGILKRYTPKIILLNLAPNELSTELSYDRLSSLLPYCKKHPEMKEIISFRSRFEKWKLLSSIYPYNSTFLTIINGIHKISGIRIQDQGYVPISGNINPHSYSPEDFIECPIDSNRVNALNEFIDQCKESNISLFLVFSPIYKFNKQDTETIRVVKQLSGDKSVFLFNFIHDSRFEGQYSLFKDNGHMNHDGATKFSEIIANIISENYKRKTAK